MCVLTSPILLDEGTTLMYWCINEIHAPSLDTIPSSSSEHKYQRFVISVSPTDPSQSVRVREGKAQTPGNYEAASPALCLLLASRLSGGLVYNFLHGIEAIQWPEQSRGRNGLCCFGRGHQSTSRSRLMPSRGREVKYSPGCKVEGTKCILCLCGALPTETMTVMIITCNLSLY